MRMKLAGFVFAALSISGLWARDDTPAGIVAAAFNVNSRYTVESVEFTGQEKPRMSSLTVENIRRLIGEKLNLEALNHLCQQITGEVHAHQVTFKLARGSHPDHVKVLFEVEHLKRRFDVDIPKFVYDSRQGWTGSGVAILTLGPSVLSAGVVTDGDQSVERFSGLRARYELKPLALPRVRFSLSYDNLQNHYNRATIMAAAASADKPSLYGSRRDVRPEVTLVVAKPLTLSVGLSFEGFTHDSSATGSGRVNSLVNTLRYQQKWTGSDASAQEIEAAYSLRTANRALGSGYAYTRQQIEARYSWRLGRHLVEASAVAGAISGTAPILDRFVIGNSTTLRGWNKYDIDPLGADRVAEASAGYGYRMLRVFYDAGSAWDRSAAPQLRQSIGGGFEKDRFLLALAFPIRQGRIDPVLIAGMNF